ncbi:MAG: hypothetical protein HY850_06535 [Betaproteobacteria bacterium]|nr:hypothetical protein [Betaproteobacteria bacterium]
MIRRTLRLLSLLFFVLTVQWGGAAHALSHLDDQDHLTHAACELCVAYSALDHGLAGPAPLPVADARYHPVADTLATPGTARNDSQPYLSRAPPTRLA